MNYSVSSIFFKLLLLLICILNVKKILELLFFDMFDRNIKGYFIEYLM